MLRESSKEQKMLYDLISTIKQNSGVIITEQEARILSLWRYDETSKETAIVLNIGCSTINFHKNNIKNKFRVHDYNELKKILRDNGLTLNLITFAEYLIAQYK